MALNHIVKSIAYSVKYDASVYFFNPQTPNMDDKTDASRIDTGKPVGFEHVDQSEVKLKKMDSDEKSDKSDKSIESRTRDANEDPTNPNTPPNPNPPRQHPRFFVSSVPNIENLPPQLDIDNDENDFEEIIDNEELEDLPVAVPSNRVADMTSSDVIIDGVVVDPQRSLRRRRLELSLLLIALLTTVVAITVVIMTRSKKEKEDKPLMPSVSPSSSSAPTYIYAEHIKQIIIPVSGEAVLDDPSTLQYKLWQIFAGRFEMLLNISRIELNDVMEIRQRYIMTMIWVAKAPVDKWDHFLERLSESTFPPICALFPCNEKGEITSAYLANEEMTGIGGGIIVSEIGWLYSLEEVIFARNGIIGTIPTEIGMLKFLRVLDLGDNDFSGSIPSELGQLESLEFMLLNKNNLTQTIPSQIGRLSELFYMDVSNNQLSGTIPLDLEHLDKLEGMGLYGNDFDGGVDYLCGKSISSGFFSEVIITATSQAQRTPHNISGELGLFVDCAESESVLECSCCECFE